VRLDTIAAPITGSQSAAVAIVRVSGPESWSVVRRLFSPWPADVRPRFALYGRFRHGDDGLAIPFAEGASFTGEESVELNIHGSPASVRLLLADLYAEGVRPAQPGEFSLRAFLHGRIDLTQAESIRDSVEAQTANQLRIAQRMQSGELRERLDTIEDRLMKVLAAVEAAADFSEEIGDFDGPGGLAILRPALEELNLLSNTASAGRILREGFRVAIQGRPNAGKSTLLNTLVGFERAIVTDIPGTTRDTLEEVFEVAGVPLRLVDTAGLRETDDVIEQMGIERSAREASGADLVLYLVDGSAGLTPDDEEFIAKAGDRCLVVFSKADVASKPAFGGAIGISCRTGFGLDSLLSAIESRVRDTDVSDIVPVQARHVSYLRACSASVGQAIDTIENNLPDDLISTCMRDAIYQLGLITGKTASADMIDRIFADFCIGK
jgi:tRNA modification GTPase